jgi:hypothetical protein
MVGSGLPDWATPHPDRAARAAARQIPPSPAEDGERGSDDGPIRSLTGLRCETRAAERDSVPLAEPLSHRALGEAVGRRARLRHRFYSSAVGFFPGQALYSHSAPTAGDRPLVAGPSGFQSAGHESGAHDDPPS